MASTIAAVTTSGGGVVTTADASGNLNLLAGTTTVVALTSAGAAVTGTLSNTTGATFATSSGSVGIGTAAPRAKLSVTNGTENTSGDAPQEALITGPSNDITAGTGNLTIQSNSTQAVNAGGTLALGGRINGTDSSGLAILKGAAESASSGTSAGYFAIATKPNAAAPVERLRIDSSGNVLVGTTSTLGGKLSVKTSGATNAYFTNDTAGGYNLDCDSQSNGGTYYFVNFRKLGTGISNITSNGTTIAYNTGSDYRLKENIQPITNALDKVAQLKPCKWDWQQFWGEGSSQGFVAHELQEVVPDCVTGEKDATREEEYEVTPAVPAVVDADGVETTPAVQAVKSTRTVPSYQGVDTSFLVATLTAAIQELKAIIDTQATRIAALEAK